MDAPGSYRGGMYPQHISRKEIETMKRNMKKVPVIQLKTEIYHNKETDEAEKILGKLSSEPSDHTLPIDQHITKHPGFVSRLLGLRHRFTSLFSS